MAQHSGAAYRRRVEVVVVAADGALIVGENAVFVAFLHRL